MEKCRMKPNTLPIRLTPLLGAHSGSKPWRSTTSNIHGHYIIICWNKDHDKTTPVHSFTVEEIGAADDRPPKEDVVMKLFDYRFELDRALRKGLQVIRIETPGPTMHEVDIYRLHEGSTVDDLKRWRKEHEDGPRPCGSPGRCARQS